MKGDSETLVKIGIKRNEDPTYNIAERGYETEDIAKTTWKIIR